MLDRESMKSLGELSALGIQLAATIIVFGALGWLADHFWHTKPWGLLIGCLFGAAGGMILFIRSVMKYSQQSDEKE